jgi:hypothetical protein
MWSGKFYDMHILDFLIAQKNEPLLENNSFLISMLDILCPKILKMTTWKTRIMTVPKTTTMIILSTPFFFLQPNASPLGDYINFSPIP